jgi:glycosyltransferase involved in cell wall biosynthesis
VTLVVHVQTRFFSFGGERYVADMIAACPAPDYRHVIVVGPEHRRESIGALCGPVDVHVVPSLVRRPDPIKDPLAFRALVGLLRELRPDVLHTIQSKAGILGRFAGRRARVPVLLHSVVMANFGPGFNPILGQGYRLLERIAARWTDQFLVNGLDLRDRFVRAGIARASDFELVRSVVATERFREAAAGGRSVARASEGLPQDVPIVLYAGALDRRKGAFELPAFFERVRSARPEARLVVAGEGALRDAVRAGFQERGLAGSVQMVGFTDRLPQLMAASDCLVMLSRAEGLATVLVHAVAAGTPFVSTDVDGPTEMLGLGARGSVVPIGDWRAAADEVVRIADGTRGPTVALADWEPAVVHSRNRAILDRLTGRTAGPR